MNSDNELEFQDLSEEEIKELAEEEKEAKYEDDYFKEEKPQGAFLKVLILIVIFLILLIALMISLVAAKNNKKNINNIQDTIVDENNNSGSEDINTSDENIMSRDDDTEEEITETPEIEATTEPEDSADEAVPTKPPVEAVMEEKGNVDYSKVKFNARECLKEMEAYFLDGNFEAVSDLAHLDKYIAMSYSLNGTKDYLYYGDTNDEKKPHGMGIAVYADNQYYYGEWENGVRKGAGRWIHFHIHNVDVHLDNVISQEYFGQFDNDLPNGEGQLHTEYDESKLKEGQRYVSNYVCSFKNGYIDGDVYCTTVSLTEGFREWEGTASEGSLIYISEARDSNKRGPVLMNRENPDDYIWLSPYENQQLGVSAYISYKR